MKKFLGFILVLLVTGNLAFAKPVNTATAMTVAGNFYKQTTHNEVNIIALVHTATSSKGVALYYVYNVNSGFVIITADDAAQPVIGYSTERNFEIPEVGSTIGTWLKKRGEEIAYIQDKNLEADMKIAEKWNNYQNNVTGKQYTSTQSVVGPLCTTLWNQSPGYNALCPGGSVTGCVATTMAMIMKYWNYPSTGTGSSSYNHWNYGLQSANYGATTYNWANMPNVLVGSNIDVATINYHCGVAVEMDYSPSGSGAWVCAFDNAVCAETAYKDYFKYDPNQIQGLLRANYDDATWMGMMKNDIDLGRPIQYVGWDPNAGGHTWVLDGYDQNDFLHMNWGWGGSGNGYFFLDLMNPNGMNFSAGHEAVIGIVPIASTNVDASIPTVINPAGFFCTNTFNPTLKLQNMGANALTSCDINYQIDGGAVQTQPWTGSLVMGQSAVISLPAITATPGTHTIVCYSSNPNGTTDGNTANDQTVVTFNVALSGALPIVEGFESGVTADWALSTTGSGNNFVVTNAAAATGANSIMIDNFTNTAGSTSIIQTASNYNLASYSNPVLTFKLAYQAKAVGNNDKLQVFASTDCGAGWISKWAHWGSTLPTVSGTSTSPFVPTASEFMTYTVGLGNLVTSNSVIFRWKFFADANGPGNNLYIDDINIINGITGIASVEEQLGLAIYPNPSNGNFNVALNLAEGKNIAVNVTDMLGRTIEFAPGKVYAAGENNIIFRSDYQPGIYFVNISVDGQVISKKVIVQ